jgi:hypothetical protein
VLLARRPRRGEVKTRLASRLGASRALELHQAFLADTLRWLAGLARAGWRARLEWSAPCRPTAALRPLLRGIATGVQERGDLGRRMETAMRRALDSGASCVVIIGADAPHLGARPAQISRRLLRNTEVVLGPAEDGGSYLIAARRLGRGWFKHIRWGTARVLRQSLSRLRRAGASVSLLAGSYDLDTVESLARLSRDLSRSALLRRRLPATIQALRAAGLHPHWRTHTYWTSEAGYQTSLPSDSRRTR